jgi:hypothetical protein
VSSPTLAEFLAARLTEDEETAKAVLPEDWSDIAWAGVGPSAVAFVTDFDPARVLREVGAKRAVLALHHMDSDEYTDADGIERAAFICHECDNFGSSDNWPCRTLRQLVSVYSDHPDYQAEWKP